MTHQIDCSDFGPNKLKCTARSARGTNGAWLHRCVALRLSENRLNGYKIVRGELSIARSEIGESIGFGVGVPRYLPRIAIAKDQSRGIAGTGRKSMEMGSKGLEEW